MQSSNSYLDEPTFSSRATYNVTQGSGEDVIELGSLAATRVSADPSTLNSLISGETACVIEFMEGRDNVKLLAGERKKPHSTFNQSPSKNNISSRRPSYPEIHFVYPLVGIVSAIGAFNIILTSFFST